MFASTRHQRRWRQTRATAVAAALSVLCMLPLANAQDSNSFDCNISLNNGAQKYDLTALAGEHVLSRVRETPPSKMTDEVRFDLCGELQKKSGVQDGDQCPEETRACLTMTNQKGENTDRIIAVIPLAVRSVLKPEITSITSPSKGVNVVFHGSSYPSTNPMPQAFNITILCDTSQSDPSFVSYNGAQLYAEWKAPAGCEFTGSEPPKDDGGSKEGGGKEGEKVGSGIGWFFLLLVLAFIAYFVIGAYYNYSTYGAVGLDLIPHRDFWRDVPYVIRDIVSHLCSAVRPTRSGYIAV